MLLHFCQLSLALLIVSTEGECLQTLWGKCISSQVGADPRDEFWAAEQIVSYARLVQPLDQLSCSYHQCKALTLPQ